MGRVPLEGQRFLQECRMFREMCRADIESEIVIAIDDDPNETL
jgi:hypothetical protein